MEFWNWRVRIGGISESISEIIKRLRAGMVVRVNGIL